MTHTLTTTITEPSLSLTHRVRAPQSDSTVSSPCLVLLHGVGGNEANLIDLAQQQDPRLTVVLARGPLTIGPNMYAWFNVNFTSSGPMINPEQAEQSRKTLIDFIDGLPAAYGIDANRIWIAGFSQGGILSASVGLTRPDKVAGFGILSGRILPEITPLIAPSEALSSQHAFVSHGVHDSKLTIEFARSAQRLLNEKEVNLTYREYKADHEFNSPMQRDFNHWIAAQLDVARTAGRSQE